MHFIIGGAYQGKLDIAARRFSLTTEEICKCSDDKGIEDFSKRCICGIERFSLYCVKNGLEAAEVFKEHRAEWKDSILICEDIFCGVVPVSDELRAMREMTGRLSIYLSNEAETVTRVFCGLEQKLK